MVLIPVMLLAVVRELEHCMGVPVVRIMVIVFLFVSIID